MKRRSQRLVDVLFESLRARCLLCCILPGLRLKGFGGLGFGVERLGFRVSNFGFRVSDFGYKIEGLGFATQQLSCSISRRTLQRHQTLRAARERPIDTNSAAMYAPPLSMHRYFVKRLWQTTTQGPSWGYLQSQFSRDLVKFWR